MNEENEHQPKTDTNWSSEEFINRILKTLQEKLGNIRIKDRRIEDSILQWGNDFTSEAFRFQVDYELNGETFRKYLHLKIPYNVQYHDVGTKIRYFKKEIYIYETILPLFHALLDDDEKLAPEYFCSNGNDSIALEDLSQSGYQILNKHEKLDFEECALCFRQLAKYHAASIKVYETKLTEILQKSEFETYMAPGILRFQDNIFVKQFEKQFLIGVQKTDPEYAEKNAASLLQFKNRFIEAAVDDINPIENELNVLNQGDFWRNNIMFKYDKFGHISSIKMIDFQMGRWTSPAIDIIYFTINSVKFDVYEKYFDLLLEIYTNTFNGVLKYLNCLQKSLNVDELKNIIDSKYSYWTYLLMVPLPILLRESVPEKEAMDFFADAIYDEESYVHGLKKWIRVLIQKGVFIKNDDAIFSIRTYLRKFRKEHDDVKITKYEFDDKIVKSGHNFATVIARLRFEYVDKMTKKCRQSVILKIPSLSPNYESTDRFNNYRKEVFVLEKLLPAMLRLCPDGEPYWATSYGSTENEIIFLEDLNELGYFLKDKTTRFDLEHCKIVLKTLARHHALSFKYLSSRERMEIEGVTADLKLIEFFANFCEHAIDIASKFVSQKTLDKLNKYKNELLFETTERSLRPNEHGLNVILHGDCWSTNILFKYDENGRVCDTKMIDWQLCRVGSPVLDLIELFVTSVSYEFYEKYENSLFDLYLNEFDRNLRKLNCDLVYTRKELDDDLKSYKLFYLNMILVGLKFVLGNIEGAISLTENLNQIKNEPSIYVQELLKWINYAAVRNIL